MQIFLEIVRTHKYCSGWEHFETNRGVGWIENNSVKEEVSTAATNIQVISQIDEIKINAAILFKIFQIQ